MPRFFIDADKLNQASIEIDGENGSHLAKSLRVRVGEEITLCDGEGFDYRAGLGS